MPRKTCGASWRLKKIPSFPRGEERGEAALGIPAFTGWMGATSLVLPIPVERVACYPPMWYISTFLRGASVNSVRISE